VEKCENGVRIMKNKKLKEEIKQLKRQNEQLEEDKRLRNFYLALIGIVLAILAVYFFAIWLKDAIPTAKQRFTKWYEASEMNKGFFFGFVFALFVVFIAWGFKMGLDNL
jgi:H+/Cl- antiporter ClcA